MVVNLLLTPLTNSVWSDRTFIEPRHSMSNGGCRMPTSMKGIRSDEPGLPADQTANTNQTLSEALHGAADDALLVLNAIIRALPHAAMIVDQFGSVRAANPLARARIMPPDSKVSQDRLRDLVQQVRRSDGQVPFRFQVGRECWLNLQGRVLTGLPPALGNLVLLSDLSAVEPPKRGFTTEASPAPANRMLREEAARFKRLSETDPLTGALNTRAFAAHVIRALKDRPDRNAALLFLDLNDFKQVNDDFGHVVGDHVLSTVTERLRFPPHTWITTARMGGDEFALWLPGVRPADVPNITAAIRARLALPITCASDGCNPPDITVTAAIGIACCPDDASSYDALRLTADRRMYADKARQYASK